MLFHQESGLMRYLRFILVVVSILTYTGLSLADDGGTSYYKAEALQWSKVHDGIGVALTMSDLSPYDADTLAEHLMTGFEQLYGAKVTTKVFVEVLPRLEGNLVQFFIHGAPFGPYTIDEAASKMPSIIEQFRLIQRI